MTLPKTAPPDVALLMGVYNGARFLPRQLLSFLEQDARGWRLYASDDGSSDASLEILKKFQRRLGSARVTILQGPRQGFAQNFLSLLKNPNIQARYYALSDQDDIWHEKQ